MSKQAKIILFSCCYILGILGFFFIPLLAVGLILLISFILIGINKNLFSYKYTFTLFLIFLSGIINTAINLHYDDDLTSYTDNNVNIIAKVLTIPSNNLENSTSFFAQVNSISFDEVNKNNINAKTLVTVKDNQDKINKIQIGDTLFLNGKLKEPIPAKNPSQFDYAKYLQLKNTFSLLYVKDNWKILNSAQDTKGKILRKLNNKRNNILAIHKQNIQSPMIEVLGGIIFGDDAVNPDNNTKENFINSGIFHILSASGMNLTIIIGMWFFLTRNLKINYRFSIISGILLILFYTCMTGFGHPIIRAFLMLSLVLIGKLIDRNTSTMALLFLVAFIMLLYNPLGIFEIGFQLSFIATFALILSSKVFSFNFKFKPFNYILSVCIVPIIAQIYIAPLQMYYFNTFNIYSVFANIIIVPVLSIVSFLGFISSIMAFINPIARNICYIADLILNPLLIYIVKTAELFSTLPYSVLTVKKPFIIQIILYFAIIIFLTCIINNKLFKKKYYALLGALILLFSLTFIPTPDKNTEIIFFSAGNADAALIKSPDNKYFILDTGKMPYLTANSQAKYIIIKYLKDKGINNIHSLILSHFDSDHAGGTIDLLKELKINNIYITDSYENTNLANEIINYIKLNNLNSITVKKENEIYNTKNFNLSILKPSSDNLISENEKSLIVKLISNNNKVLFMGDGNINTYNSLPKEYKNANIIKSGHHGGKNTVNDNMSEQAEIFIISTGPNVYNHPHPETIKTIENHNKKIARTDYHNAIKLILTKNKYEVLYYSPKTKKFVKPVL